MRRIGSLWPELISFPNLYAAFLKARYGKRSQASVARFDFDQEYELIRLQIELEQRTYRPGAFFQFTIRDPKPRVISAAPFRDRVVHHAFCNVVEPIFERSFIHDSYACRVGKGTHAAVRRYADFARHHEWVLKCDVRRFFPHVDHLLLKERLARRIKDKDVLWLAGQVIDHGPRPESLPVIFPGDDLFTALDRPRGLPIGNQTSQFFGNVFLDTLDHFVKETLRCRGYVRYVDDFLLLDNDPRRLTEWRDEIERFLASLRLRLHPTKRVISRTRDGIRFLGYRVWPDHRLLPAANVRRFRRRLRQMEADFAAGLLSPQEVKQRIAAWVGHAQQADIWKLREALLGDACFQRPQRPRRAGGR